MKKIVVIQGPNLNLLGEREPDIYGKHTLKEINEAIAKLGDEMKLETKFFQSNHEGAIIDYLHEQRKWADWIVINPGALSHYSYALRDAIASVELPAVEVHLSDIYKREPFRKTCVLKEVCRAQIVGDGLAGYLRAVEYLVGVDIVEQLRALVRENNDRDHVLKQTVAWLDRAYPKYTWVGIYLTEGDELVLHNFIGRPSPHTRIAIGEGICGAAASSRESIIVPDVNADPRYLACSVETRSEIVVPIMRGEIVFGEIDIDSDMEDSFHKGDREILEKCAEILATLF